MSGRSIILPLLSAMALCLSASAEETPFCNKGWSAALDGGAGVVFPLNESFRTMLASNTYPFADIRIGYSTGPDDPGIFNKAYNYPTVGFGVTFSNLASAGYTGISSLSNIVDIYSFFERDIIKKKRFSFGYDLLFGFGFNGSRYDPITNPGNEIFNSAVVFDIGGGLMVKWRPAERLELSAAARLRHHSIGKLAFPNSGLNEAMPTLSLRYYLDGQEKEKAPEKKKEKPSLDGFRKGMAYEILVGAGIQRCLAEWDIFNVNEPDPKKKVSTINAYPKFFGSVYATYRYATKFSSGIGLDLFCSSDDYIAAMKACDTILYGQAQVDAHVYSPFSCGISAVHNFHYGNFSLWGSVGIFLYKAKGISEDVGLSYQKIGFKYSIPQLYGLTLSMCCKNYFFSQAEMMEFGLGIKI